MEVEKPIVFRGNIIDRYRADLIVKQTVIVELKCCESLGKSNKHSYLTT
jgi:GxxExxY protein